MDFWTEHWLEILFGLIAAGALGTCKVMISKIKNYKQLLDKQDDEHLVEVIDTRLEPLKRDLQDLREILAETIDEEEQLKDSLVCSYRFRLIQLCKIYIRQKYITQEQYDQLSEFFKLYEFLGGNGQAKDYYERAIQLPIVDDISLVK